MGKRSDFKGMFTHWPCSLSRSLPYLTLWWEKMAPFWGEEAPSSQRLQKHNIINWFRIILSLMWIFFYYNLFANWLSPIILITELAEIDTWQIKCLNLILFPTFLLETCYNDILCTQVLRNQDTTETKKYIYIIVLCV